MLHFTLSRFVCIVTSNYSWLQLRQVFGKANMTEDTEKYRRPWMTHVGNYALQNNIRQTPGKKKCLKALKLMMSSLEIFETDLETKH